jgi:hypothetical protein
VSGEFGSIPPGWLVKLLLIGVLESTLLLTIYDLLLIPVELSPAAGIAGPF